MTGSVPDITRWNRAGLDRFKYTAEGAAEFTELLRVAHLLLYTRGQKPEDIDPPDDWRAAYAHPDGKFPDDLDLQAKLARLRSDFGRDRMDGIAAKNATYAERLLAQYQAVLTDPSAQISRAFARGLHVLSETLDAYANEGTLRTATQTVHALHLLSLIGFRARPAASAVVPIAYQLKPDAGRVNLPAGTGFDHPLPEGGPVLAFEALEAVQAHPSLNAMKAQCHDSRRDPIGAAEQKFELVEVSSFSNDLVGSVAVLEQRASREAVRVLEADRDGREVVVQRSAYGSVTGNMQKAAFLSAPRQSWAARPAGGGWVHFAKAPGVFPQAIVYAVKADKSGRYYRVDELRGRDMRITGLQDPFDLVNMIEEVTMVSDPGGPRAMRMIRGGAAELSEKPEEMAHPEYRADPNAITEVWSTVAAAEDDPESTVVNPAGWFGLFSLGIQSLRLKKDKLLGDLEELNPGSVYIDGVKPAAFEKYDFLVFETGSGGLAAAGFTVSEMDGDAVRLVASGVSLGHASVVAVHGGLSARSGLAADRRSRAELIGEDSLLQVICPVPEQDMLRPGRRLLLAESNGKAVQVVVSKVVGSASENVTLSVDAGGAETGGLRKGFTTVYGNVATFGHGKSLPGRVLGSGDGGQAGQVVVIEDDNVSTRLNPAFPGGVAADIQITVEGRIWQQVAPDFEPAGDGPHYSVELQSDGKLAVRFHRVLPTGNDNVALSRIRVGAGAAGNDIPPGAVTNLQPKHSAVESIRQLLAPQSGADQQGVEALRSEGKSRYALFDRALGVDDFARLAESHSGVIHAHARLIRQGAGRGGNQIRLTVVPAGGGEIGLIKPELEKMLLAASLPATTLDIRPYNPAPLSGRAVITLLSGYADQFTVGREIEAGLMARFGLDDRPLGRVLYVSALAAEIEAHPAVDFVTITLDPICETIDGVECEKSVDEVVQALRPNAETAVFLKDPSGLGLEFVTGLDGGRVMDLFKSRQGTILWQELPEFMRLFDRDVTLSFGPNDEVPMPGDLRAYLAGFGHLLDRFDETLAQFYADGFFARDPIDGNARQIQPWLVPYFADLFGVTLYGPDPESRRSELEQAIWVARRRGTRLAVDRAAESVLQRAVVAVPGLDRVLFSPSIRTPRLTGEELTGTSHAKDPIILHAPLAGGETYSQLAARHPGYPLGARDIGRIMRARRAKGFRLTADSKPALDDNGKRVAMRFAVEDRAGLPCFPFSFEDRALRTPDIRAPRVGRDPDKLVARPDAVVLHVDPPPGMFDPALAVANTRPPLADGKLNAPNDPPVIFRPAGNAVLTANKAKSRDGSGFYEIDGLIFDGTLRVAADCTVVLKDFAVRRVELGARAKLVLKAGLCHEIDADKPATSCELEYVTLTGKGHFRSFDASDCLLHELKFASGGNRGCLRYSRHTIGTLPGRISATVSTAGPFRFVDWPCLPDPADNTKKTARPALFGEPGYGVLSPQNRPAVTRAAEDGGELGGYHNRFHLARLAAAERRAEDFTPAGHCVFARYDLRSAAALPKAAP